MKRRQTFGARRRQYVMPAARSGRSSAHAAQLRKLNRTLAVLSSVNQMIVREREPHALFAAACRIAVEQGGFRMAWIGLFDSVSQQVRPAAHAGNAGSYLDQIAIRLDGSDLGRGPTAVALRAGRPVTVNDIAGDPRMEPWRERALALGYRASAAFPLMVDGEIRGTLNLYAGKVGFFDADEVEILGQMAADIALALKFSEQEEQRRQARQSLQQSLAQLEQAERQARLQLRRLRALRTIDQAIIASLDIRLTLRVIVEQAIAQLGVDAAAVLLLHHDIARLEYAAGQGFRSPAIHATRLRLGEGLAGRAALDRQIVHVADLGASDSSSPFAQPPEAFVSYYAVPLLAKGQVEGVLEVFHRARLNPDGEWLDFLETLGGQAAIAIADIRLFEHVQRSRAEIALAYDATIAGWSQAMDLRDKETEGHSQRVTDLTVQLARAAGMPAEQIAHVRRGALLHDIGKLGVPDDILLKAGPLSDAEWAVMRRHPQHAYDMLASIEYLRPALDIPYCHHERWDGSGYPRGLRGEQIPLAARLFAVVDVWDALRSDRPYRQGWPADQAAAYLREHAGSLFDPWAVELFFQVVSVEY